MTIVGTYTDNLSCSPIKVVRELGSERRETVRSISGAGVRALISQHITITSIQARKEMRKMTRLKTRTWEAS